MRILLILVLLLGLASVCLAAAWPDSPHYRAIMWVKKVPKDQADLFFQRVRQAGCNACSFYPGMDPELFSSHKMPFYVENVSRGLFLGNYGDYWHKTWQAYWDTRDAGLFVRKPCLNDPAWFASELHNRINDYVPHYAPYGPFAWDIRDEPSITTYGNPFDFCFSPFCMAKLHTWLKEQYGSLAALNAEWGTEFATWDEVKPLTSDQVKARAKEQEGKENYAPWADHREFMDLTFAEAVHKLGQAIKQRAPGALVGLEGMQAPSAFGGYDYSRLLREVDWLEPYDSACTRQIVRSFRPDLPVLKTIFSKDPHEISRQLWQRMFEGDSGAIVWWSKTAFDASKPDLPLTDQGKALATAFAPLTSALGDRIIAAGRPFAPVAVRYSQANIRSWWMEDSKVDGKTWPKRFSSYEHTHSTAIDARKTCVRLLQDAGFPSFAFVNDASLASGALEKRKFRVLILPAPRAMSTGEAAAIQQFLAGGGWVICLGGLPTFDEHCRQLQTSPLQQTALSPRFIQLELAEWREYLALRLKPPAGQPLLGRFSHLLARADVHPWVKVSAETGALPPAVETWVLQEEGASLVCLMRNAECDVSGALKDAGNNTALDKSINLTVDFGRQVEVHQLNTAGAATKLQQLEVTLEPWSPLIFEVRPALQLAEALPPSLSTNIKD